MLNILVLNAPNFPLTEQSILIEPVDALTLATWAKHQKHSVTFIDLDRYGTKPLLSKWPLFDVAILVFDYMIPLHTTAALELLDEVFERVSKLTETILMVGRPATYYYSHILTRFPLLTACILGEAEPILDTLFTLGDLKRLSEISGIITRNHLPQKRPFRRVSINTNFYTKYVPLSGPIADRTLCQLDDYIDVHSIISSRGCSGACSFCSTVQYWGAWQGAPPKLVLAEMKHLEALGVHKIIFLDDNFANDSQRVFEICNLLRQKPVNCLWGCLCRIEDVSPELLKEMVAVGCRWIHFGIEHGSFEIRSRMGKKFTNEQVSEVIRFAKALGLRVRTSWILDLPGFNHKTISETFKLSRILSSHEIKLHFLAIRPGSTLYRNKNRDNSNPKLPDEIYIHKGSSNTSTDQKHSHMVEELLHEFRLEMTKDAYQWVDDITFWRKFNEHEAAHDERFLSTVVTRYGLGWV